MAHNDDQKPGISRDGACANQDPDQKVNVYVNLDPSFAFQKSILI